MSQIRGRFQKEAAEAVIQYTSSLPFDWRMYPQDIRGSIAHARMLAKQGIISTEEAHTLEEGLKAISLEISSGKFNFKPELEDIHMAVESRLLELVGTVAGKLHTARSRNDQVSLDMRLYTKDAILKTRVRIRELQRCLLEQAETNQHVFMPGYTHLQIAQPILLAHHLLAYFEMLDRDYERFGNCSERNDVMPLGSGALAGVAYNIDRDFVACELSFSRISQNSLDAVSDRDFVIEYMCAASLCMMHLSRMAEELVLWASSEFGFVEMDDSFATASSIMPQKKNPDVAELGRGKAGRVFGHLMGMLATMKGLPLSYNRDLQEDKEALFDTVDTLNASLEVFSGMISTLKFRKRNMERALENGYILATDLADFLVKKGVSFREAHGITGRLVTYAIDCNKTLDALAIEEYQKFSPLFTEDVRNISAASSIASKNVPGGTAPGQVANQISLGKKKIIEKP
jgi:argininosuccinate lyase